MCSIYTNFVKSKKKKIVLYTILCSAPHLYTHSKVRNKNELLRIELLGYNF